MKKVNEKSKWKKISNIIKKWRKSCPLAALIVASTIVLSCGGIVVDFVQGEKPEINMKRPMFASILNMTSDEEDFEYDEYEDYSENEDYNEEKGNSEDVIYDTDEEESLGEYAEETIPAGDETNNLAENGQGNVGLQENKAEGDQNIAEGSQNIVDPANGVYLKVKKDYFDDALFIGDSRVQGLKLYSELDNATFYCKEGVSLTKLLKEKFVKIKIKGKKKEVTIVRALKEKQFGKIYLMIGINEVGYRETDEFKKTYGEVIKKIRELQPEAKIIILGMMKVTTEYAKSHPSFKNKNIQKKNDAIAELADNVNVFYLDFNPEICDSKGGIKKKYTWDGVHLKAEYYSIWVKFMKKHGV